MRRKMRKHLGIKPHAIGVTNIAGSPVVANILIKSEAPPHTYRAIQFLRISRSFNLYNIKDQHSAPQFAMATMKAVGVAEYGPVDNFESRDVPRPGKPTGRDVLVK
jgi:hypothetical protein